MADRVTRGDDIKPTPIIHKKYVLMLYTGGTIGMKPDKDGGLKPGTLKELSDQMKSDPWLNDCNYVPTHDDETTPDGKKRVDKSPDYDIAGPLATKVTEESVRIIYWVLGFIPLIDSSNMGPAGWNKMAERIQKFYKTFDGFVILHGTDTMAYTSSALAFMLEGLKKPVVITGSQVPLYQFRTDAEENLKGALIMASNKDITEVTLFFYNNLLRGCRAVKVNSSEFEAFKSPNFEPLAEVGVNITVKENSIFHQQGPLKVHQLSEDIHVGAIRIFPGITKETVRGFLSNLNGAVLESFGAGNAPQAIIQTLKEATSRKVLIVNVTQCLEGTVDDSIYDAGEQLLKAGVVPGADMTSEAALGKMAYILSDPTPTTYKLQKKALQKNLRGELTPTKSDVC